MNNLESFFKSFYFYLFKSFSFYQDDFQLSQELKLHLHLEFGFDLPIWVPNVCQIHSTIKWPYTLCLSCIYINPKPKLGTSNTYKHDSNLRTIQSKGLLINPIIVTFLADSVPFKEISITPNVHIQMPQNFGGDVLH